MAKPPLEFLKNLLRANPEDGSRYAAAMEGLSPDLLDQAHSVFSRAEKIEMYPIGTKKNPGFILMLDQKLALWFYQNGDRFTYDGFEIGPYGQEQLDPNISED